MHVRNSGAEIRRLHDRIAVLQRRDAERACYVDTLREDHVQEVVMFERMIRARDAELDQQRRHISELQAQCRRLQESLAACVRDAQKHGWTIVSDTSFAGYMTIPRYVMAGYGVFAREVLAELDESPTHVFIQAGVGGAAADGAAPVAVVCIVALPVLLHLSRFVCACQTFFSLPCISLSLCGIGHLAQHFRTTRCRCLHDPVQPTCRRRTARSVALLLGESPVARAQQLSAIHISK